MSGVSYIECLGNRVLDQTSKFYLLVSRDDKSVYGNRLDKKQILKLQRTRLSALTEPPQKSLKKAENVGSTTKMTFRLNLILCIQTEAYASTSSFKFIYSILVA